MELTDKEMLEEIQLEYENNVKDGLLPRIGDGDYEWLIERAKRAESLEMRYENAGAMFSRQNLLGRFEELEQENKSYLEALQDIRIDTRCADTRSVVQRTLEELK